jgi:hypothetical protein
VVCDGWSSVIHTYGNRALDFFSAILTSFTRAVCLTKDQIDMVPIPGSLSCSLFHLPTSSQHHKAPSLRVPGTP